MWQKIVLNFSRKVFGCTAALSDTNIGIFISLSHQSPRAFCRLPHQPITGQDSSQLANEEPACLGVNNYPHSWGQSIRFLYTHYKGEVLIVMMQVFTTAIPPSHAWPGPHNKSNKFRITGCRDSSEQTLAWCHPHNKQRTWECYVAQDTREASCWRGTESRSLSLYKPDWQLCWSQE